MTERLSLSRQKHMTFPGGSVGKESACNAGVKVKVAQSCLTLWPHGLHSRCMNSPGQNTGEGSLSFLQGIVPTQGSNPGLSHCRQILYQLSHKGRPRILEWVACPFSSRSSQPRNQTGVSCIEGWFFTNWAKMTDLKWSQNWKKRHYNK